VKLHSGSTNIYHLWVRSFDYLIFICVIIIFMYFFL